MEMIPKRVGSAISSAGGLDRFRSFLAFGRFQVKVPMLRCGVPSRFREVPHMFDFVLPSGKLT